MKREPDDAGRRPAALLLIGIHREELAFGRAVADSLSAAEVAVLAIPEGLSGRRPRPDERFHYDTLHRALYLQLLPHVVGHYPLLIDLHTGEDPAGPSADLFCADPLLRRALQAALGADARPGELPVRVVPLESSDSPHASTVIPPQIWNNPAFCYLGIELYLPPDPAGLAAARELAHRLVRIAVACARPRQADACP